MLRCTAVERFVASILDAQGTRHVDIRVRTKSPKSSALSTLKVRARVRTQSRQSTTVTLQLRAATMASCPPGTVQTGVSHSLHELSFEVQPNLSWSTATIHVNRAHGERRILTHAFVAGRSMSSSTPARTTHLALSTIFTSVLLVIGSFIVASESSKQHGNAALAAEPLQSSELITDTSPLATRVEPPVPLEAMTVASPNGVLQPMTDTTESLLLAGIPDDGRPYLVIPRLHLRMRILNGVSDPELGRGVGWYRTTAALGDKGNLGLAGHRTTKPAPFYFLDRMQVADSIFVVHEDNINRYEVIPNGEGAPTFNVSPSDVSVIGYIGFDSITLTTCTPIGTTNERLIVRGRLRATKPFLRGVSNG